MTSRRYCCTRIMSCGRREVFVTNVSLEIKYPEELAVVGEVGVEGVN